MVDTAKFWDKMADKYSKRPVPNEDVYQIKKISRENISRVKVRSSNSVAVQGQRRFPMRLM